MDKKTTYYCTLPVLCSVLVIYEGLPGMTPQEVFDAIGDTADFSMKLDIGAADKASPEIQKAEWVYQIAEGNTLCVENGEFTIDETEDGDT